MNRIAAALAVSLALCASTAGAQEQQPPAYQPPPPPAYPPPPPAYPPQQPVYPAQPGYAPAYPPPVATAHRHLGFALRLDLGGGYLKSSSSPDDYALKGGAGAFGVVVGGAVSENLILGGDFWGVTAASPTLTQFGQTLGTATGVSLSLTGIGLNVTYYFMPANVYLSLSPSICSVSVSYGGVSASTENGFGMKLGVGKEWWVADHWGIGAALQYFFSSNKDTGPNPPTWSSNAFAVAFSATYN